MIVDDIRSFVAMPREEDFERLARAAFAFQIEHVPALAAAARRARRSAMDLVSWRDVPLVPAAAFATVELAAAPAVETFRSSGTLGGERSVHRHPFPDLYRAVVDATFPRFCLPGGGDAGARPAMLSLVPPRAVAPDSSLAFMVDHVVARFGGPASAWAFGERGVEGGAARSWLSARQREHRPVVILSTSFALADLLDFLGRIDLKFRLPAGSVLFETGGFKGREKALDAGELRARVERHLGLAGEAIVAEYGMTELTSQAYATARAGGAPDRFVCPPWLKVRALDPETLAELPDGETGLLAFFDLANVGSALHVLTEDLGSTDHGGFRLAGRAPDAALRGCSLLAEELASGR